MEGLKLNFNPRRPKWANKILKKRGQSEISKDEGNDDEIDEIQKSQFEVNLSLKIWSGIIPGQNVSWN